MHNFLVVFQPHHGETVATMRVVDAWSSSSASLVAARKTMLRHHAEGQYGNIGEGQLQVVKQDTCRQYLPRPAASLSNVQENYPVESINSPTDLTFFPPLNDACQYSTCYRDDKPVATLNRRRVSERTGPVWQLYATDGTRLSGTYLTRYRSVARFAAQVLMQQHIIG